MHEDANQRDGAKSRFFAHHLSRSDLVALMVALFILILALAEPAKDRLGGIFSRMIALASRTTRDKDYLMRALERALVEPALPDAAPEELFDEPTPVSLRGNTVLVEGSRKGVGIIFSGADLFETGSAVLHENGRHLLEEFAALVRSYPNKLEIVAFVSEEEAPRDASELSWQRVQTVMEYLERRRISRDRFLPGAAGPARAAGRKGYPGSRIEVLVEVQRSQGMR